MGLRGFHIFFIVVSIIMGLTVSGWFLWRLQQGANGMYTFLALLFLGGTVGLMFYLSWFLRRHGKAGQV